MCVGVVMHRVNGNGLVEGLHLGGPQGPLWQPLDAEPFPGIEPWGSWPVGVGRRVSAGLQSLADRAHFALEVVEVGRTHLVTSKGGMSYGDTDQRVRCKIGEIAEIAEEEDGECRQAMITADVWVHTSVGGRVTWRWHPQHDLATGRLVVRSRASGDTTEVDVADLLEGPPWRRLLEAIIDRVSAVIAARAVQHPTSPGELAAS